MIMKNFSQRLKSVNKFFQRRYQFSNISLMFVQTFRSYFREEIFYRLCLNSSVMQVGVFSKAKTGKHNEKSKHTSEEKIGKQRNPNNKNKKQICTEGASENLMQQIPWETERK